MNDTPPLTDAHALDRFIAAKSPEWLKRASIEQLDALRESLSSHHHLQARVGELLGRIQAPKHFAEPRLLEMLRGLGCTPQPARSVWRDIRLSVKMPVFRITDVDLPSFHYYPVDRDLWSRLLGNFEQDEAQPGPITRAPASLRTAGCWLARQPKSRRDAASWTWAGNTNSICVRSWSPKIRCSASRSSSC
ncbi:hypothetical protein CSV86_006250 [Pseudomonas putida CSV86]|uniref:Uncharacterized protein n=1 Tax=Pseudomonas bharatica CSV86 TaxID=1005395 RepID=A0A7K4EBS8_9PSED|nr:hypothetical protein [Pseudomonas bharatica]NNJ14871.1 hypothetical protein [Pseudomonas bharatica CSV86]